MDALMLPSNWQRVRLGDIAEIKRGASPRPIENPKWFCANSNVGWVRISDISKNSRFLYKTAQKLSKKGIEKSRLVKQNSLIMSMCATIGKPIITKIDTCIHDGFVVFENPKIDLNYLYYFLCYIEKEWLESGQQGSQVNLNVDLIKNKEVFYPKDLNEQIAIANILSGLDRYLYALRALILKKEGVKKALSFELLSQRKRLKGFNQAWQRVRLGDILELLTDYHANGSYELLKNNVTLLKHVDFAIMIRTTNFENNDFKNDLIYINKKAYEFLSKSKVFAGDILVNKIANAGTAYFMPKLNQPVSLGMNLFLLRIKPNYNNFFIFKQIANYERVLKTFANGSATKTITKNVIKNLLIPLPPLNEQIAIANILSGLDNEIISLKNKKRQFENIKKALNHDLMSAKIRVLKK
ncbi:restriction endonuclease subunit S [Helicobacter pylori]|uniref:restriction endonuclease subunit S n=1 Tax=Helicobacter pylori TaxID=210 RepID=UPI002D77B7A7|nr:restriction endonuclease subunit S [Helicobacter pylori]